MKLVLATGNKGKVREITKMYKSFEVIPYTDLIEAFDIIEDEPDFKGNALIKARAVYKALGDEDAIVFADDSGISVDVLDSEPGVLSARYAGENVSDIDNLNKLMKAVKEKGFDSSAAFYTAAIAIVCKEGEYTSHGWMYGNVIVQAKGEGGFGYDPCFIPLGYDKTLGELDDDTKSKLSHRSQALANARPVLDVIKQMRKF
ncbi:non-canonical purine NTP pyrophosphatase [Sulfurimonas sp. MAG313]|nr:non-canonical purine NTP pyrophosphatase [Sulfurimonas sp. MAG313]MDF1880873.1 non-canonical purine NTP pyrophosphatase [Sulfurimonas sp. MAG313]